MTLHSCWERSSWRVRRSTRAASGGKWVPDGLPVIGKAVAKKHAQQDTSDTPKFPRIAFLAVTDQEIALLRSVGRVQRQAAGGTARVPRSDVASAGVSRGLLRCGVTIRFTDGGSWELEVSRLIRRRGTTGRSGAGLLAANRRTNPGLSLGCGNRTGCPLDETGQQRREPASADHDSRGFVERW